MGRVALVRGAYWVCFALGLAGCATGVPVSSDDASQIVSNFTVCRNLTVSNAPKTDASRRISPYAATVSIRNRTLLTVPTNGCLSSGFGRRPGRRSIHEGIDISTYRRPSPVVAAGDGRIVFAERSGAYGLTVMINHGRDIVTQYSHLSDIRKDIKNGDKISRGTRIGSTGKTGSATGIHLHYEVRVDGKPVDILSIK
ncbi:MAG: M23 family metallopeptidase [Pseudomonadota bacterium]